MGTNKMYNICPECGLESPNTLWCRCTLDGRTCPNDHNWHRCHAHGIRVFGSNGHKGAIDGCTCHLRQKTKNEEMKGGE